MPTRLPRLLCLAAALLMTTVTTAREDTPMREETRPARDARMQWWREARFGMFIHWGLYAISAGEWQDKTDHGEWILHTAQIPVERYEQFKRRFNPVKFDADEWVRIAKDAGMRYIVITSKHHDGFCLFDSAHTDYDVMSTPFKRDIMAELADACRRADLRICWYHSIMDWHHPDYLPRRGWENRSADGADYGRFVERLKGQVRELLTKYGPIGVMWFDGEWEDTWDHKRGVELYNLCRQIQPNVIVNNRVDKGRQGMQGLTKEGQFAGDFGTPEQDIPPTGLPGVDWETCMTMNRHWGYNAHDDDWKSTEDLIRKLADIASKGGNFLLNVGPKADGTFPRESIDRLREIGAWMKVNGESIHGTSASPFKQLPWGRCTQRVLDADLTRLYMHVFDWPADGRLRVPGLANTPHQCSLLAAPTTRLKTERDEDAVVISVPAAPPDKIDTVVVLDIIGRPSVPIDESTLLTPAPRQMAWQQLETHAFIHFGINTFTDREWGDGTEDPAIFNPTELDARQWVRVLKDAGMKQLVLSAKHHDGFCLWPSAYTEYSLKNSPWRGGKGDLVREVADACRDAGMKLGIYLSPWDRHEPSYGDSPRYNEHYKNQLRELLTGYGPVHEVWFDGACGEGPNGKKQIYDWPGYTALIRKLQPDAVIFSDAGPDVRWVGNEQGFAGKTNWSTLRRDEFRPGGPNYRELTEGHEDGTHWVPAECDVSIRPGWFYHAREDKQVKSVAQLVDIYYKSVGRNAVLLLNVPPDRRGLIHEADAERLREFRAVLDETFRSDVTANPYVASPERNPIAVLDNDAATRWTPASSSQTGTITLDLGRRVELDRILLQEAIEHSQRVQAFAVEAWTEGKWQPIASGTTIGYKRLLRCSPVKTDRVRLLILDARAAPMISEFHLYRASLREGVLR